MRLNRKACVRAAVLMLPLISLAFNPIFSSSRASANSAWTLDDSMKIKSMGEIRVSPDGSRVAYTLSEPVLTGDKSDYTGQIYLAKSDGSAAHQLTSGEKPCGDPQWSPDGRLIAFTTARSGKSNIWIINPNGGEAEQLTDVPTGVQTFRWSPDGSQIAFVMSDAPTPEQEKAAKEKNDASVVDENFRMSQLWVVSSDLKTGTQKARQLTHGNFTVGSAVSHQIDWSPDGKSIAFTYAPTPKVNDWHRSDISIVDVASGNLHELPGPKYKMAPFYSPDGKWIAFAAIEGTPVWAFNFHLMVAPAGGGEPRRLADTYDSYPSLLGWSADSNSVYFTEPRGTLERIYSLGIQADAAQFVDSGSTELGGVELNGPATWCGFVLQTPGKLPEGYVSRIDRWNPVQITHANDELAGIPVAQTKVINWKSTDGATIEGLLTYPAGYHEGNRYPLLVIAHGGPAENFQQNFIGGRSTYPIAVFAAEGYAILRCNVRGSTGYGAEFRFKDFQDWGGRDYRDLMSGVDHLISIGLADPNRLGMMGWSYGGYMTSWVISQTQRFKAASVGAGVTDLISMFGNTDIPDFVQAYFGNFWDDPAMYRDHSAIFHIKGAKTPTLLEYGTADPRVPPSQGFELYRALKAQGTPTEMVLFPRSGHAIGEPRLLMDAARRNLEWFKKYLGN